MLDRTTNLAFGQVVFVVGDLLKLVKNNHDRFSQSARPMPAELQALLSNRSWTRFVHRYQNQLSADPHRPARHWGAAAPNIAFPNSSNFVVFVSAAEVMARAVVVANEADPSVGQRST